MARGNPLPFQRDEFGVFADHRAEGLGVSLYDTMLRLDYAIDRAKYFREKEGVHTFVKRRTVTYGEWDETPAFTSEEDGRG